MYKIKMFKCLIPNVLHGRLVIIFKIFKMPRVGPNTFKFESLIKLSSRSGRRHHLLIVFLLPEKKIDIFHFGFHSRGAETKNPNGKKPK